MAPNTSQLATRLEDAPSTDMVLCNCIPIDRPPRVAQQVPTSGMSHLICIADDCLAANCDEGAKAAAEAAIMAPRARENFIFSVWFWKNAWRRVIGYWVMSF